MNGLLERLFPASPMMGLLGEDQQQQALQQSRQQGLLGLAAGLLQAGGPSRTRTNIGQAVGSGLMAGQQMYQQALNQQLQGQLTMEKVGEARRLREQQAMARQLMPQLVTTERQQALTTGSQAADPLAALIKSADAGTLNQPTINQVASNALRSLLPPADFAKVMDSIKTQFEIGKPSEVKSPFAAVDPSKYTPESLRQFAQTKDYATLRTVDQAEVFTGDFANFSRQLFGTANPSELTPAQRAQVSDAVLRKANATAMQVNMPGETANLLVTKAFLPRVTALTEEAASAQKMAQAATTINTVLKGAGGGGVVKISTDVQRFLGLPSDRVTADDLAQALATQTAVGVRASGSGATSDMEFKAYLSAVPSLSRSEEGRAFMADYARRRAKRSAQQADFAAKLLKDGNYSELAMQEYDEKLGPLIGEEEKNKFLPQLSSTSARGVARRSGLIAD
jgi:hypothetical protein